LIWRNGRQLAAAKQNLAAAKKTVEADEADLELAKLQFSRADDLMKKGAGTIEARDQTNATLKRSNAAPKASPAIEPEAKRDKIPIRHLHEQPPCATPALRQENCCCGSMMVWRATPRSWTSGSKTWN
jgi:multidrug resistance efflux pump